MNDPSRTRALDTVPVGEKVLGRVINAAGEPLDGMGALEGAPRYPIHAAPGVAEPGDPRALLETGLKAIDLLAPLAAGALVDLLGPAGVGKLVLMGELINNLAARRGGVAVCAGLEERTYQAAEFLRQLGELGVEDHTAVVFWSRDEPATTRPRTLLAALTIAEQFRATGREVLFCLDKKLAQTGDSGPLAGRLLAARRGGITTVLFDPGTDRPELPTDDRGGALLPNVQILFSHRLAAENIFPAIDPLVSSSKFIGQVADGEHQTVARVLRELLRTAEDVAAAQNNPRYSASSEDQRLAARARRIRLFLSQPMFVAEAYTGIPGEYVSVGETIRSCRALLSGQHDNTPEEALHYVGGLD